MDGPTSSRASFQSFSGLRRGFSLASSQGDGQVIVVGRTRNVRQAASSLRHTSVVAMSVAAEELTVPVLNDLPLLQYINQNGRIQPPVESDTKASVFAIFDKNKKIQYIGFSKDVRNSLRTLMGRRPDLCYFFKIFNLTSLDQKTMLKCRQQVRLEDSNLKVFSFFDLVLKAYETVSVSASVTLACGLCSVVANLLVHFSPNLLKEVFYGLQVGVLVYHALS